MINPFHIRLKIHQAELIDRCGGIERAAGICHYGKSTVGRWNDRDDPTLMPIAAIAALEADCGVSVVSTVMLEAAKRVSGADRMIGNPAEIISLEAAELMRRAGDAASKLFGSVADGDISSTESEINTRALVSVRQKIDDLLALHSANELRLVKG